MAIETVADVIEDIIGQATKGDARWDPDVSYVLRDREVNALKAALFAVKAMALVVASGDQCDGPLTASDLRDM